MLAVVPAFAEPEDPVPPCRTGSQREPCRSYKKSPRILRIDASCARCKRDTASSLRLPRDATQYTPLLSRWQGPARLEYQEAASVKRKPKLSDGSDPGALPRPQGCGAADRQEARRRRVTSRSTASSAPTGHHAMDDRRGRPRLPPTPLARRRADNRLAVA